MKVHELVAALETVTPTLGPTTTGVPLMSHYWFTGQHVLTYNDHLAMQAPCPSIGGKLTMSGRLLPVLKASYQQAELKFVIGEKEVSVQMGRSKTTLPSFGIMEANILFKMPKLEEGQNSITGKLEQLRLAIEACRLSIDENHPQRNGISIIPEEKRLALYSFNNDSLTRCELPGKFSERITLPGQFWSILLALTGKKAGGTPEVLVLLEKRRALAKVNDVLLFAKTLETGEHDLRKLYEAHYTSAVHKRLVPITAELQEAITRAAVLSKDDNAAKTVLQVSDGVLHVLTDSLHGHGNDRLKFGDHPDTGTVTVRAQSLLNALERFTDPAASISISKRVVALREQDRVHLLSGTG